MSSLLKKFKSPEYNMIFNIETGELVRWGQSPHKNAVFAPGPEILDIEVSTHGCPGSCPWCYKGNTPGPPVNMTFKTFYNILGKMNTQVLTQIAFGITGIQTNPDLFAMMTYARHLDIMPNITISGHDLNNWHIDRFGKLCGAVAVSANKECPDVCFDAVYRLTKKVERVNIQLMVYDGNQDFVRFVIDSIRTDPRLAKLTSLVLLSLKQKNRGVYFNLLPVDNFIELVEYAYCSGVSLGVDSCSAHKIVDWAATYHPDQDFSTVIEPCESTLFSAYINVHGVFYPCSFEEGVFPGIPVMEYTSFDDVWSHPLTNEWRTSLLSNCRRCQNFVV